MSCMTALPLYDHDHGGGEEPGGGEGGVHALFLSCLNLF